MYKTISSLTAAAALALGGAAFADDATKSGGVPGVDVDVDANISMPMADKNSDGKVSKAEAASNKKLASQFDSLDTNKDGHLDKAEFARFEGSAKGKADRARGNKDGAPGKDDGTGDERAQPYDRPGTTDDSVPGNEDKLGPGR
jgi:hypothetical protein